MPITPVRKESDMVTFVTFRGRKTGKELRRAHTAVTDDAALAERLAIQYWGLANDINRLVKIETKRRSEWREAGEDMPAAGTIPTI